jgi:hypothetical protein
MPEFDCNTAIPAFVNSFLLENKADIAKLATKAINTHPMFLTKLIGIELEKACHSFVRNKHEPAHIKQYLFATAKNTINRLNNDDDMSQYMNNIENHINDKSLITQPAFIQNDIKSYYDILINVIDTQMSMLEYSCTSSTIKIKQCMYAAFKDIAAQYPEDIISYLIFLNKNRLQSKIFQRFIYILEQELPFNIKKSNRTLEIKSLLDPNLHIFSGISEFATTVYNNNIVNMTSEIYRSSCGDKPYYIGKLLDIDCNRKSLLSDIKEYGFSSITMNNTPNNVLVIVKHLRIPPHYQMGGLAYLNKIRRSIVDKTYFIINGKKRTITR